MIGIGPGAPTLTEVLRFRIDFDAAKARAHRTALATLAEHIRHDIQDGDTLKFSYAVQVQYFGEVARKLDALLEILEDEEMVLHVDLEEMIRGRSVIRDVLAKLEALIDEEARP